MLSARQNLFCGLGIVELLGFEVCFIIVVCYHIYLFFMNIHITNPSIIHFYFSTFSKDDVCTWPSFSSSFFGAYFESSS